MAQKGELHIRNKHNGQYDFPLLIENYPPLKRFVSLNPLGVQTINFFNPQAVKALNKALLISYYGIRYWDIPKQYLCPPIPGRADYIHYIADLIQPDRVAKDLQAEEEDANEQKTKCRCLDVGVGANCIYPIIGHTEYGWTFVGSDIDPVSIENARKIVTCNPVLAHKIDLRLQKDSRKIFDGIIMPGEYFDVTICNPPFHSSKEEAEDGTLRKLCSLKGTKVKKVQLNFGGSANELWCEGGEIRFIHICTSGFLRGGTVKNGLVQRVGENGEVNGAAQLPHRFRCRRRFRCGGGSLRGRGCGCGIRRRRTGRQRQRRGEDEGNALFRFHGYTPFPVIEKLCGSGHGPPCRSL